VRYDVYKSLGFKGLLNVKPRWLYESTFSFLTSRKYSLSQHDRDSLTERTLICTTAEEQRNMTRQTRHIIPIGRDQ